MKTIILSNVVALFSVIALLLGIGTPIAYEHSAKADKSMVLVEVYINNNGEDYIKNIHFDDGTVVGDYNYSIKYVTPSISLVSGIDTMYYSSPMAIYFDYAAWITRDGVVSLSLDPNSSVRASSTLKETAWNVVSSPTIGLANSSDWPTETQKVKTFKWQYDCHFSFANNKDTWNIEPSRSAGNYLTVVLAGCNP